MDRRAQGLLLLVLAVLAALVVPNLGARSVPGLPRAAAIPGPPNTGDCLLDPLQSSFEPSTGRRIWTGTPRYAPCAGDRVGEVVLVEPDVDRRPRTRSLAYRPSDTCTAAAAAFIGLPPDLAGRDRVFGTWFPAVSAPTVRLAPDVVQWAGGQRWAACVVLTPGTAGSTVYPTSLRGTFEAGLLPQAFGTCWDTTDPVYSTTIDCGTAHAAEGFGFADDLTGTTQEALDTSCRRLVDVLTAMPDATAGGTLSVGAAVVPDEGEGGNGFALCRVAAPADRTLTGTLLGLGTGEIPWE
ncbi:septum formation family protein [Nakamurella flavida]|uniref:Septum formation family protein n=1 Tax=Nakamurella flavida TaxID=363630 RepID=A0A938YF78_9ACTN|nr:septum formation family protein [Nakamurella flavida]MBM9476570.1 septum formation family protein [Nakamurella flavida]MDP9778992.1 hypothetical protein [Nakamurella flavida]